MKKKVFIVLNPVSGGCNLTLIKTLINSYVKKTFGSYTLYQTSGKESVSGIVRDAVQRGYTLFIAIGGDGTVAGVANGLINTSIPLAIIPAGTANCLAQELSLPLDFQEAFSLISEKFRTKKIDGMKVGERYFFLDIAVGAKSIAIKNTKRRDKQKFGMIAYAWSWIKLMIGSDLRQFIITVDGNTKKYRASEIVIANGSIIGTALLKYGSDIKVDNGKLTVCVIRVNSFLDYVRYIVKLLSHTRKSTRTIQYITVKKSVKIESKKILPIQADGEIIQNTPVEIVHCPKILTVISQSSEGLLSKIVKPLIQT